MTKKITIENASLSVKIGDQGYEFPWVNSGTINDPRENTMAVSPQGTGNGVVFRTGTSLPVTADFVVREVPAELFPLLKQAFESQQRINFMLYDQINGDTYEFNDAVIRTNVSNTALAEGETTLDVPLNTSCAPTRFVHRSPEG